MMTKGKLATAAAAFVLSAAIATPDLAAGEFEGVWKVTDSGGKPFEITLSADGTAKANRPGDPMKGKWTEQGSGVVITWDTGWTTKILKEGGKYTKTAFEKGAAADGKPTNTSPAEKVK
jgi:hypothetical protein